MWPFRNLKRELKKVELDNANLRDKLHRANTEWRKSYSDLAAETREEKDAIRREGDTALAASQRRVLEFAAERDEAVIRARNVAKARDHYYTAFTDAQKIATLLKAQLASAMVRDPKTGRMVRWTDTVEFTLPEGYGVASTSHGVASTSLGLTSGTQVFVDQSDESLNGVGS